MGFARIERAGESRGLESQVEGERGEAERDVSCVHSCVGGGAAINRS